MMNYYQMPYMAVLIRCYELGLPESNYVPEAFLQVDREAVRKSYIPLKLASGMRSIPAKRFAAYSSSCS